MTYIIMETHLSYCVALDEAGRFLKVANKSYETGQIVEHVVPFTLSEKRTLPLRAAASLGGLAACLVLAFTLYWSNFMAPFASVYLSINPQVRMAVNRRDAVVGLEGLNEDGDALMTGYAYRGKPLEQATDELVDRAIELGFLSDGGKVSVSIDAPDEAWFTDTGIALRQNLNEHLAERMSVTIEVKRYVERENDSPPETEPESPATQEPIRYGGDGDDDADRYDDSEDGSGGASQTARPTTRPTIRPTPTQPPTPTPTSQPTQTPRPATPRPVRGEDDDDDRDDDDNDDSDDDDDDRDGDAIEAARPARTRRPEPTPRPAAPPVRNDDDGGDDDDRPAFGTNNDDNYTDYDDNSGGNTDYESGDDDD